MFRKKEKKKRKNKNQVRPRQTAVLCVGPLLVCKVLESRKWIVGSVLNCLLDDLDT